MLTRALLPLVALIALLGITGCPPKPAASPSPKAAEPATTNGTPDTATPAATEEPLTPELERILKTDKKLRVGLEAEFKPFEYKTDTGDLVGFDVDLAKAIAGQLGVPVEFTETKWEGIIPDLLSSKYDLIMSGMTATEERSKTIAFSNPYYHTGLCVLLNKEKAGTITEVHQLDDPARTVALKTGTTSDIWVTANFTKAKVTRVSEEATAALEVSQGRADAMVYDMLSIKLHHDENPDTTLALLDPFTSEPYAIGLRQEDTGLQRRINTILESLEQDGTIDTIYKKHFGDMPRVK
ncbi:MAG: transporter substrate-binding domain-containing protein [bacterium]